MVKPPRNIRYVWICRTIPTSEQNVHTSTHVCTESTQHVMKHCLVHKLKTSELICFIYYNGKFSSLLSLYTQRAQRITITCHYGQSLNKFQTTVLTIQHKDKNFAPLLEAFSCLHCSFSLVAWINELHAWKPIGFELFDVAIIIIIKITHALNIFTVNDRDGRPTTFAYPLVSLLFTLNTLPLRSVFIIECSLLSYKNGCNNFAEVIKWVQWGQLRFKHWSLH